METLESMIRQELIREVEDLNERLAKLRERFSEVTSDVKYSGKLMIIAAITDRLT